MRITSRLLTSLVLCSSALWAQSKESLLIGPGDLLHVQVFDTPELEQHARVTDAGVFPLIMGGDLKLSGLTPSEASRSVESVLREGHFLLNPRVSVNVEQYATQNVSVLGEVHTPGAYPISTPQSILNVLTLAGGLTDLADRTILIQRHGSSEKIPYRVSNDADTALETAIQVNPGDTVLVPKAGIVYVLGDVSRPGGYPKVATALSDLSYPLYLVHLAVLVFLCALINRPWHQWAKTPAHLAIVLGMNAVAIGSAFLFHVCFQRHTTSMRNAVRKFLSTQQPASVAKGSIA